jgi:hypothetical protein
VEAELRNRVAKIGEVFQARRAGSRPTAWHFGKVSDHRAGRPGPAWIVRRRSVSRLPHERPRTDPGQLVIPASAPAGLYAPAPAGWHVQPRQDVSAPKPHAAGVTIDSGTIVVFDPLKNPSSCFASRRQSTVALAASEADQNLLEVQGSLASTRSNASR